MEEFFKNKLNEPNDSNDNWDMPDDAVWGNAKKEFLTPADISSNNRKYFLMALVLLLILGLGAIAYWQNLQLEKVKSVVEVQRETIEKVQKEKTELNQKLEKTVASFNDKSELFEIEKDNLIEGNKNLAKQIRRQEEKVRELIAEKDNPVLAEKNKLANELNDEPEVLPSKLDEIKSAPIDLKLIEPLATLSLPAMKNTQRVYLYIPNSQEINVAKHHSFDFEIGYEYAQVNMSLSQGDKFNKEKYGYFSENHFDFEATHGVHLAFSPIKSLFVKTGFRKSKAAFVNKGSQVLKYDKEKEYEKPGGGWGNDIVLETGNPFSGGSNDIGIVVSEGDEIESEESLKIDFEDQFEFDFYQIPFGLEYYIGKKSLQLQLQLGGQWNRMVFSDFKFSASVDDEKEIIVDKVELNSKEIEAKQFVSTYAGLGLNYRLAKHLHIRTSLNYDFNMGKGAAYSELKSRTVHVGLIYRL